MKAEIVTLFLALLVAGFIIGRLLADYLKQRLLARNLRVGNVYRLVNGNPWAPMEAKVLEIKDGWVRYKWTDIQNPQSMEIMEFVNVYR